MFLKPRFFCFVFLSMKKNDESNVRSDTQRILEITFSQYVTILLDTNQVRPFYSHIPLYTDSRPPLIKSVLGDRKLV